MKIVNDIVQALVNRNQVNVLFCNLSRAFNWACQRIILPTHIRKNTGLSARFLPFLFNIQATNCLPYWCIFKFILLWIRGATRLGIRPHYILNVRERFELSVFSIIYTEDTIITTTAHYSDELQQNINMALTKYRLGSLQITWNQMNKKRWFLKSLLVHQQGIPRNFWNLYSLMVFLSWRNIRNILDISAIKMTYFVIFHWSLIYGIIL